MATKAQRSYEFHLYWQLDDGRTPLLNRTTRFRSLRDSPGAPGVAPGARMGPYRAPLTESQREALKRTGGCFACRKSGLVAMDCPEKGRGLKDATGIEPWKNRMDKIQVKEEVIDREMSMLKDAEYTPEPSN